MNKDEMLDTVTTQRLRLADVLDQLTEEQWNTPSLCEGWKVRDVVGHLLSILEIPVGTFVLNAVKARNFDRYADRVAREFGSSESAALAQRMRASAGKRFAPPVVGPIAPLTDVCVHTRDIERPLGMPSRLDPDALRATLSYTCGGKARGFVPASRTKGLTFTATDLALTIGTGPLVQGPGEAILMAATGRPANNPSQLLDSPDGTPGNSYVTLSGFILASGYLGTWGAPEISAYIGAMIAERYARADPLLNAEFGLEQKPIGNGAWFNSLGWFADRPGHRLPEHIRTPFSERTLRRGIQSLERQGLIGRNPLYLNPRTKQSFQNGRKFLYQNNFTRLLRSIELSQNTPPRTPEHF